MAWPHSSRMSGSATWRGPPLAECLDPPHGVAPSSRMSGFATWRGPPLAECLDPPHGVAPHYPNVWICHMAWPPSSRISGSATDRKLLHSSSTITQRTSQAQRTNSRCSCLHIRPKGDAVLLQFPITQPVHPAAEATDEIGLKQFLCIRLEFLVAFVA